VPNCNAFKNHMCIKAGHWFPCCRFNGTNTYNIKDYTFEQYKATEFYQDLAEEMQNEWALGCLRCKLQEERTGSSYRHFFNREMSGKDQVEFIEITLSNECNLACRMCDPTYSTLWSKILELNPDLESFVSKSPATVFNIEDLFANVDLRYLKKIKYLGGEPFITPQIKDLFEYLDSMGIIQNLRFECNTNCTLFPTKWIDYLEKFNSLEISLSVDGVGQLNDYIRHGKSWSNIVKNILMWKEFSNNTPNVSLDIFSTVQAYNLHDIKNLKEFANQVGIKFTSSVLMSPEHLSIGVLPNAYLNEIKDEHNAEYYKSILEYNNLFEEFKKFTLELDKIHNVNYEKVIPQLKKYMETQND